MFNCNCHFILILAVVFTTIAHSKQKCDVKDKIAKALCNVIEKTYPQDDGKFSMHGCNCLTAIIKSKPALCDIKDYDFSPAPTCKKLFESKEFEKLCSNEKLLNNYFINVIFKNAFKVCTESEDKVVKGALKIHQPGWVSKALLHLFETSAPPKTRQLFSDCFQQTLAMATKDKE